MTCTNTPGSFTCGPCPSGYDDTHGDGTLCTDIDECAAGTPCLHGGLCTNTPGSYSCDCSGTGYTGDDCDTDIDECAIGGHCDPLVTCTNTPGSFTCGPCPGGYEDTHGDGTLCTDIDECAAGTDDCTAGEHCRNIPGSWTCDCPTWDGYYDDGAGCVACPDEAIAFGSGACGELFYPE